jgi:predicted RNA-binding protein with RPS1 domain
MKKPHIALFAGDPAGIGPELIQKLLQDERSAAKAQISLIGQRGTIDVPAGVRWVDWPGLNAPVFERGVAAANNGRYMLEGLAFGAQMVHSGAADALCFAPLNKGALRAGGMTQEDELRWFAELLSYEGYCGELNVLENLWTARVTSHVALKEVSELLTAAKVAQAIAMIHEITFEPEIGDIYEGPVVKVIDAGAFVSISNNRDGFIHISELAEYRVDFVEDVINEGDIVKVKVIGFDKKGRPKLSFRCVDQATGEDISDRIPNKPQMVDERESGGRDDRRGGDDRRGSRDRDDRRDDRRGGGGRDRDDRRGGDRDDRRGDDRRSSPRDRDDRDDRDGGVKKRRGFFGSN